MAKRIFIPIALLIWGLDQLTKWLIVHRLVDKTINLGICVLHLTTNRGGAFGILPNFYHYFTIAAALVLLGFIIFIKKILALSPVDQLCLGMIAGGALGNLTDRFRLGYVVDFIDFKIWPVFNLADSCITLGVVGLILLELTRGKGAKKDA